MAKCYLHLLGDVEADLLAAIRAEVPSMVSRAEHSVLWGVDIAQHSDASDILLLKFLRAADLNVEAAVQRLIDTLRFRSEKGLEEFASRSLGEHFQGHDSIVGLDAEGRQVMISRYGGMDNDKVFGNPEAFLDYRMSIMERAMKRLSFRRGEAEDLCQVHDYSGVPLLFKTTEVKNCIAAMSQVFSDHYPETKGKTLFVNFPNAFSKLFQAFCVFLPERTRKKFLILGESDQALLFQHLRPEAVPEDLGGMLSKEAEESDIVGAPCSTITVSPRSTENVCLKEVKQPKSLSWELRVCSAEASVEVVFAPRSGSEEVVLPRRVLKAKDGIVSGTYAASTAGALRCRFSNDKAWFQSRVFLHRTTVQEA